MLFLEFAAWGAYLTSQGRYLGNIGMGSLIGWFFSVQVFVSIFMPALIGIIADKDIPAQKVLGYCHALAGISMVAAGVYGVQAGEAVQFAPLFALYTFSVAFFMPTIALTNTVSYNILAKGGEDPVTVFPKLRVFGTIGFIIMMLVSNWTGFQDNACQYILSGGISLILAIYSFTLPNCEITKAAAGEKTNLAEILGLKAFTLFKDSKMAIFFIFSFLLGAALQVSNGFANTFLANFGGIPEYANSFAVKNSNVILSISQVSETLCILLIPFFLKKFGIKVVMLMAMFAWTLRFGFFGLGNPNGGAWLFILSMIVYGVAFDFFNISGSLFVEQNTSKEIRGSAQGLFMLMTNGLGASIGSLAAQAVVTACTGGLQGTELMTGWSHAWYIFAAYAFVVGVLFMILFKNPQKKQAKA